MLAWGLGVRPRRVLDGGRARGVYQLVITTRRLLRWEMCHSHFQVISICIRYALIWSFGHRGTALYNVHDTHRPSVIVVLRHSQPICHCDAPLLTGHQSLWCSATHRPSIIVVLCYSPPISHCGAPLLTTHQSMWCSANNSRHTRLSASVTHSVVLQTGSSILSAI